MKVVSLYARVSSEKQAQKGTIESQIAELERRISEDEHKLLNEYRFIDNGYSGSDLERPDLDRLRDKVGKGEIDKIYIHSPDRLSRKTVYQMILLDEFEKAGVEVIFLNYKTDKSPESNLLLQMQGAVAEYERAKMMERYRRGRLHAARRGSVSVIGKASYGYRYIKKGTIGEEGKLEINEEEAKVVRELFMWVGEERIRTIEVICRLKERSIRTQTGKERWNKSTISQILKNPVYKGQAVYGRTKAGQVKPEIRPKRNAGRQKSCSRYSQDKENWIYIAVPRIVDEELFNTVQEQLAENRERVKRQERRAARLLQGLTVCQRCRYAYCGTYVINRRGTYYYYYRCIAPSYKEACGNRPVQADALETTIWKKVKGILKKPERLINEYQRHLLGSKELLLEEGLEREESKLKRGISGLIDSYASGYINQEEFELRIKGMKQRLKEKEEEKKRIKDKKEVQEELTNIIGNIKEFCSGIKLELDQLDWLDKRSVVRKLIERIEINVDNITIVFRIKEFVTQNKQNQDIQAIRERIARPKSE
ncbi:recombinase family protein [Wolbachia endosymbiont (group A) of Pipizella viduata]|uniref:recombinase family protein n=1 Tax=Wolbachia endosymbiont (group A) of Pipizella viduata TaxID=3066154 RepID=UPI003340C301